MQLSDAQRSVCFTFVFAFGIALASIDLVNITCSHPDDATNDSNFAEDACRDHFSRDDVTHCEDRGDDSARGARVASYRRSLNIIVNDFSRRS